MEGIAENKWGSQIFKNIGIKNNSQTQSKIWIIKSFNENMPFINSVHVMGVNIHVSLFQSKNG